MKIKGSTRRRPLKKSRNAYSGFAKKQRIKLALLALNLYPKVLCLVATPQRKS
jgi:hypothetical protein